MDLPILLTISSILSNTSLLLFGVVLIFLINKWYRDRWDPSYSYEDREHYEYLELMNNEKGMIMRSRSVSAMTFYQGDITQQFSLKKQVLQILKANPWLAGRLMDHRFQGKSFKEAAVIYPKNFDDKDLPLYYQEVQVSKKDFDESNQEDIALKVKNYLVPKGNTCLNKPNEVLFKVSVFKIYDPSEETFKPKDRKIVKTALLMAMSHILGDGHTFYTLYSFLDGKNFIKSLIVPRIQIFLEIINEQRGDFYSKIGSDILLLLCIIVAQFFFLPQKNFLYRVNAQKIQKAKDDYQRELEGGRTDLPATVKYLSTNDILTAQFFKIFLSPFSIMTVNFRNRFPQFTDDHAGNYEHIIAYSYQDYSHPANIRLALQNNFFHGQHVKYPTTIFDKWFFQPLPISNWASFYSHLSFPMTTHLIHFPVFGGDGKDSTRNVAIIFKPNEKELAVSIYLRETISSEALRQKLEYLDVF